MPRILSFTVGPESWKSLLADPGKHWRTGYSARTLAHCWEAADGFPQEVAAAFAKSQDERLANLAPLLAVPEFKVKLPGGVRASQNDIFVLARSSLGPVCVMVEGKVNEPFGPTLAEWQREGSTGKAQRLNFLLGALRLRESPSGAIRYQLFHRAASALITAEQYRAVAAVVLVHSFSEQRASWSDYEAFLRLYKAKAEIGGIQLLSTDTTPPLYAGWVDGNREFLGS